MEFKRDREDQQCKLLDFNPRLMLSDGLTAYCGINLPVLQYLDVTVQRPAPREEYSEGVKWVDTIADFHAFKHQHGELKLKDWFKALNGARAFALFAWDDPLPFLVERKFGLSYGRILAYLMENALRGNSCQAKSLATAWSPNSLPASWALNPSRTKKAETQRQSSAECQ